MSRKMSFAKRYLSPFLGTDRNGGYIRPPFAWATLFCLLAALAAGVQIAAGIRSLTSGQPVALEGTIATLAGLAAAMVAVYNQGRRVSAESESSRMLHPPGAQIDAAPDSYDRPEGPQEASSGFIQPKSGGGL